MEKSSFQIAWLSIIIISRFSIKKSKTEKCIFSFFDGDSDSDKGKIVMKETVSLKILKN